jgi:hypothetical protein
MKFLVRPLVCAALTYAGQASAAPSLVLSEQPAWNGWLVETRCRAGFREHGGPGEAMTPYSTASGTVLQGTPAGTVVTIPLVSASALPDSGVPKDKAQGSLAFSYTVGTAANDDVYSFTIDSTTSAEDAKKNFGAGPVAADAVFECELKLRTFAPIAAGPQVRIPALPALTSPTTETMNATFNFAPAGPSGFSFPGDSGWTLPLTLAPGQSFEYILTYSIVTPYGEDPHISYTISGGAADRLPANVVPNPEFEITGPAGATVVTTTPNALDPSAAASWTQTLLNGTNLTSTQIPSTDTLGRNCGNMLHIESDGQFTGSSASPIAVDLADLLPVGSSGSLDIQVISGSVTLGFAVNGETTTFLDTPVTVTNSNPNWQHVKFSNPTLPTGQIQIQIAAPPGESAIVNIDNVVAHAPLESRSSRYDYPGAFGSVNRWISNFAYPNQIPAVGDFDGDGLDDIVTFLRSAYVGSNQDGDVYVALNTGSGFVFAGLWQEYFCVGDETPDVGDFDGDGRDDVVTFVPDTGKVWVALSTGSSFCNSREWYDASVSGFLSTGEIPAVGDVNGDGLDDIVKFTRGASAEVWVALNTGRGFAAKQLWHDDFCPGDAVPKVGDVNGDQKADVVCFRRNAPGEHSPGFAYEGMVEVALSDGSTGFSYDQLSFWNSEFAPGTAYEPLLADLNGDGSMDILAVHEDGRVFAAVKTGVISFGTGIGGTNTHDPHWQWQSGVRLNGNEKPLVGKFNRDLNDDLCVFTFGERAGDDFAATFVTLCGDPFKPFLTSVTTPSGARAGEQLLVEGTSLFSGGWYTQARLIGPDNTILTPTLNTLTSSGALLDIPTGCYPSGLYRFVVFDDLTQEPSSNSFPVRLTGTEDAWLADHFSPWQRSQPTISGDDADPDMDGLANIAEFLFGTDPRVPQFNYLPWDKLPGNEIVTQFNARADRGCVNVTIQHSENLDGWTDGMSFDFEGTGPAGTTVAGFLVTPATTAPKQFARLRFSRIND